VGVLFWPSEEVLVVNIGLEGHIAEEILEAYALGKLSDSECAPLEEDLLLCPTCQDRLLEIDEYVRVVQAATERSPTSLAGMSCA
jgi:anti-sigma factor RsiW